MEIIYHPDHKGPPVTNYFQNKAQVRHATCIVILDDQALVKVGESWYPARPYNAIMGSKPYDSLMHPSWAPIMDYIETHLTPKFDFYGNNLAS